MKNILSRGLTALALGSALTGLSTSCTKDLDQKPKYEPTPDKVFVSLAVYKQVLAKLYAGFAVAGQFGPDGDPDIGGIDGGTGNYLRQYWSAQELSTDEAVVAWNDTGIQDWHNMSWDANNVLTGGLYTRCYYEIAICNEFIREASDDKLSTRLPADAQDEAKRFRTEARFLRAVAYYNIVDLFGNGPFTDESYTVGGDSPEFRTRQQLFDYVEAELLACANDLPAPHANEYGRVDKAAAWGYLARLYLNAEVYTGSLPTVGTPHGNGTPRWADAAKYAKMVIDGGYSLAKTPSTASSSYGRNFLNDNNTGPATSEIVWPVIFDVNITRSYGGTTFLVNGSTSTKLAGWQRLVGQTTGWGGMRTTRGLFNLFFKANGDTTIDRRGRFWTQGQTLEISDQSDFTQGLGVVKYRNVTQDGTAQGGSNNFSGVDYPMLRTSEMMLTYAEAALRGGGDQGLALDYVNQVRARAFENNPVGTLNAGQLTTDFILDERGRELFWEGTRRTDLIRYRQFTEGSYLWPWKGGVAGGKGVQPFRELYPLPNNDLTVNRNLKQNAGY